LAAEPEMMIGGEVVIGNPEDGTVLKYKLDGKSLAQVVPMPDDQQTLMDTSLEQGDDGTKMTFTKYLSEEGLMAIDPDGPNDVIGAIGSSNISGDPPAPTSAGDSSWISPPDCVDSVVVVVAKDDAPADAPADDAPADAPADTPRPIRPGRRPRRPRPRRPRPRG